MVLSIQAGNNLLSDAPGTEQNSASVPAYVLAGETASESAQPEIFTERLKPEMGLVSATFSLQRLVFNQGPQRVSDTVSAGQQLIRMRQLRS